MRKILAIDDRNDNLSTLKDVLNSHLDNCDVLTTNSGEAGIQMAIVEQPDIILLDIIMPNLDGFEVCTKLKSCDETKSIPVILITAIKNDTKNRIKALKHGADAFMTKPFNAVELIAQIEVMIRIKKIEAQLVEEKKSLEHQVRERTKKLSQQNKKLLEEVERRKQAEITLQDIATRFSSITGFDFIEELCQHLCTSLDVDYAFVGELSKSNTKVQVISGIGNGKTLTPFSYELKGTPCEDVIYDSLCSFPSGVQELFPEDHLLVEMNIESYAGIPLSNSEGKFMGVMVLLSTKPIEKPEIVEAVLHINSKRVAAEMERLKAEATLIESEEKYRNLIERATDGICILQDNLVKFVNPSLVKMWGGTHDEIVNTSFVNYIYKDEIPNVAKYYQQRLRGENVPSIYETILQHKNGDKVYVEISAGLINYESKPANLVIIRDVTDRKLAEAALVKLSAAVEQSPSVIAITNTEGIIEYVNPKFVSLTGYSEENLYGKEASVLKSGYHDRAFYEDLWNTIKSGQEWYGEFYNKKKNGDLFWESASISPILDNQGQITHFVKVAEDITEFKKANQALIESEQKFKDIANLLPQIIYETDLTGKLTFVNHHAFEVFGYSKEEFNAGINVLQALIEEDRGRASKKIQALFANEQSGNDEYVALRKDGTTFPVLIYSNVIMKNNKPSGLRGVIVDITERKKAEQDLMDSMQRVEESERKFRELFEKSGDALLIIENRKFVDCNQATIDLLGYKSKDEFLNVHPSVLSPEFQADSRPSLTKANEMMDMAIKQGTHRFEWDHVKQSGAVFPVEVLLTAISDDPQKEIIHAVWRDITNRKKAQRELIVAKEKAEESDRLKSAFLANMSHEIRTPMNGIMGFADLLKEPGLTGDQQSKYLNIIEKSGERMLNTINDLMDISRIEAGQMQLNLTDVDMSEQLDFIHAFFSPEAAKKGIGLSVVNKLSKQQAQIYSDKEKIYAIFTNLVKNAIKFSHGGQIEIGLEKEENQIKCYVKDNGIGIPQDRQQAVFDRFVHADIDDTGVYEGSGLGLPISKAFVEMLGGHLWVQSTKSQEPENKYPGSTFWFTIPCVEGVDSPEVDVQQPASLPESNPKALKILIVEDDETNDLYLSTLLKPFTRELLHADSGDDAVKMCKTITDIDLLFMDIKLPGIDGYAATKHIRKFNKEVIIIAQTAYALSGDRERALQSGCNEYISKPIDKKHLRQLILKFFN